MNEYFTGSEDDLMEIELFSHAICDFLLVYQGIVTTLDGNLYAVVKDGVNSLSAFTIEEITDYIEDSDLNPTPGDLITISEDFFEIP